MHCVVLLQYVFYQCARNPKTTPKQPQRLPQKLKPLKIKHLSDFFGVLGFAPKRCLSNPPDPTDQSVSWHDFCSGTIFAGKTLSNSIHLCHTTITTIKTTKPLKIKDLVFCGSLCGSFVVALWFLAHCKKSQYNKAPPNPLLAKIDLTLAYPPCLAPPHSTKQALNPCLACLLGTTQDLTPST